MGGRGRAAEQGRTGGDGAIPAVPPPEYGRPLGLDGRPGRPARRGARAALARSAIHTQDAPDD